MSGKRQKPKPPRRRGSTLVELAVSTVLVGVLMTAALTSTGQALLSQRKRVDRVLGRHLAHLPLADIQAKAYEDPDAILPLLGLDLGETLGLQSGFDDVDDYHNYSDSPPKLADGTVLTQYAGWSRSVQVTWLHAATLAPTASSHTGVKQIRVTASYQGVPVSTVYGLRSAVP